MNSRVSVVALSSPCARCFVDKAFNWELISFFDIERTVIFVQFTAIMTELENYQPNPEYQIALPSVTSFVDQSGTALQQPGIQPPEQQLIGQNGFLSEVRDYFV